MEKIELKVLYSEGTSLLQGMGAIFGMAGGTIGRGGQNKLILPGADGSVARVHAMVRLDHAGAYIANLSESKPIWVAEQSVQSGEEIPLKLHTDIRIGIYTLQAMACGSEQLATTRQEGPQPPTTQTQLNTEELSLVDNSAIALHASTKLTSPLDYEHGAIKPPEHTQTSARNTDTLSDLLPAPKSNGEAGLLDLLRQDTDTNVATLSTCLLPNRAKASWPQDQQTTADYQSIEKTGVKPDSFVSDILAAPASSSGIPANMAITSGGSTPRIPATVTNQHLPPPLIPDDFNAFAARAEDMARRNDGWSIAGLDLNDVQEANLSRVSDELVRDLPLQGKLDQALDDPSHSGLPRQYATAPALDPLKLFGGVSVETDPFAVSNALPRGAELSQAFSLPRSQAVAEPTPQSQAAPTKSQQSPQAHASLQPNQEEKGLAAALPPPIPQVLRVPTPAESTQTPYVSSDSTPTSQLDAQEEDRLNPLAVAFAKGAGIDRSKVQFQITPEFMHTFGEALRVAVQGTIDLLAARSEIKREFRAGVTIIASGANNPLKFLPSAEGVIMQMTNRAFPGFMPPVPAMEEAFMDLRVHQLALMAGIRAAYAEALTCFDPGERERRGETNASLLDRLLTNGRKAALWDDYKDSFETLRRHAEDDLMAFSGRSFLEAYEQAALAAKDSQGSTQ